MHEIFFKWFMIKEGPEKVQLQELWLDTLMLMKS